MPKGNVGIVTPDIVANRLQKKLPYYDQVHADWIKPVVDRMLRDRRATVFSVSLFGKDVGTLEKMISRSINFMVDNNDTPDRMWYKFKKATWIRKAPRDKAKEYITLEFKLHSTVDLRPKTTQEIVDSPTNVETETTKTIVTSPDGDVGNTNINFQDSIENFINNDKIEVGKELIIKGITLDYEGIMSVKASVVGISEVELVEVSEHKIVIRRVA